MTIIANAVALLDRAHELERRAANSAIRIPRDLARARRALRAALLLAVCPDACRLADDLSATTARLIAQGRSGEVIRARRQSALASVGAYRPETVTPEISEALGALRAAVARAEAIVGERVG